MLTTPSTRRFISDSGVAWVEKGVRDGLLSKAEAEAIFETEAVGDPRIFFSVFTYKPGMMMCPVCGVPHSMCLFVKEHQELWYAGGYSLYDWQLEILTGDVYDYAGNPAHMIIVSGGPGCGKTQFMAMSSLFYGVMNPGFRLLTAAPTVKQNAEVIEAFDKMVTDTAAAKLVSNVRRTPTPFYYIGYKTGANEQIFTTGSFASRDASRTNLGKEGDVVRWDEAGIDKTLSLTLKVLGTRARGIRADGTERGIIYPDGSRVPQFTIYSNPNSDSVEWDDLVDRAREWDGVAVYEIGMDANKAVTPAQLKAATSAVMLGTLVGGGTVEQALSFMRGEQNADANGPEFSSETIKNVVDRSYQIREEWVKSRTSLNYTFVAPREEGHIYIVTCDPGTFSKPRRNSPVVMLWDMTSRPTMVGLYWGSESPGRNTPFIKKMREWIEEYDAYALVDTTGPGGTMLLEMEDIIEVESRIIRVDFGGRGSTLKQTLVKMAEIDGYHRRYVMPYYAPISRQLKRYEIGMRGPQDLVIGILLLVYWMHATGSNERDQAEQALQKYTAQRRDNRFFTRHIAHKRPYGRSL